MGERLFERLKPVCIELIRSPSIHHLTELSCILKSVENPSLQPLQQYVLLPLRIILKSESGRSTELVKSSVDNITLVFIHSTSTSWEVFADFFVTLCLLLSSGPDKSKVADVSEELKHSAVKCLTALIHASSKEVELQFYSIEFLPPLGHAVSIILTLVEKERLRQLRIDGMHFLASLVPEGDPKSNIVSIARKLFCSFLPGISMALCRIINGDPKQGQNVTTVAIATWMKIVSWMMSDDVPIEDPMKEDVTHKRHETPPTNRDARSLVVSRTSDWLKSTAEKLNVLIGQICLQRTNDSWKIRLALVWFAKDLLLFCKSNLSASVGRLLELLVSFLADDWPQVSAASLTVLNEFKVKHMSSKDRKLVEVLEGNLHTTMTALPRLMRSTDDDQKLSTLNLIQGYLTLLGSHVNQFLRTSSHLRRLSMSLLQVLEFDVKDMVFLEEAPSTHSNLDSSFSPFRNRARTYSFKGFTDDRILEAIIKICHLLGTYGDLQLLADHFLELFQQSDSYKKQAAFVLNEILKGTLSVQTMQPLGEKEGSSSVHETIVLETVVEMVFDEYLSECHWSLTTSSNQPVTLPSTSDWLVLPQRDVQSVITLYQMQSNTILACLLLEGIGASSMVLGSAFDSLLIRCLYPVLEKMAAEKTIIRQTAFETLQTVAVACGYSSIPDLLSSNADYLVDSISSKLRHFEWYQQAPHVLRVTVEQCDADMLPLLEDTIEEILWSLDTHFSEQALLFVSVLQTIGSAILRWFPPDPIKKKSKMAPEPFSVCLPDATETDVVKKRITAIDDIRNYFVEYHRNKRVADGEDMEDVVDEKDDSTVHNENDDDGFNPDKKKDLPLHVKILVKILERCQHLLSTLDPRIRLKILTTVQICVQALASEENELLPVAHKLWSSLIPRFQDEEQLVICMACETLKVLSGCCGDFLRQRVSKDVVPTLISILQKNAETSRRAGPIYSHSAAHKLQLSVLNLIGPLCRDLDVGENVLGDISYASLEYLSCRHPPALQEACVNAFGFFMKLEPDSVWLLLNDVYCPCLPTLPSQQFPHIKFDNNYPRAKEFETNIRKLLSELQKEDTGQVQDGEG